MHYKKFVSVLVGVAACTAMAVTDANAQRGGGRRGGGAMIGHGGSRVVAARTFGPRTRGFYPGRIHTGRIANYPYRSFYNPYRSYRSGFSLGFSRGFGYPYRYGRFGYPYGRYYAPYYSGFYNRYNDYPYSVYRNAPYGYVTVGPGYYYSHGRAWTDTSDDTSTATSTSDR